MIANSNKTGLGYLQFLIGNWKGYGAGFEQKSEVTQSFQYILQNQFIQSETKSIARAEDGTIIEVHEDLEIFSYDSKREKVILRGFYSEGYVNVYVMELIAEAENQLVFTSEKTENAGRMMVRQRFAIISENEYELTLDLAKAGQEFTPCQVIKMKKIA